MAQRLNHLEHHRVPQGGIRDLEIPFGHDALGELARSHLPVDVEMADADVGDLALLEKAMADHIPHPLPLWSGEQFDRRVHMCQVVFGLGDLRLIGLDPAEYLGALLRQRLDNQRFGHADIGTNITPPIQSAIWCVCYLRPSC